MRPLLRPRLLGLATLVVATLTLAACGGNYPNSTFQPTTEFNRDLTGIWDKMMLWGTVVFVIVEALLLLVMFRFRRRPGTPEPKHVHGNTIMEITWTLLPAVILGVIAIPTVKNIWKWQTDIPSDAVVVEVIGHQWWWEFRYPQYKVTTANELYMPIGRAVKFELRTADVIHSFWIPALGGKRDLVNGRTNVLWFTPDSSGENAFNGSCNEFCGTSHANMRFRAYTVTAENFESWARHQAADAVFPVAAATPAPATPGPAPTQTVANVTPQAPDSVAPIAAPAPSTGYVFPTEKLGAHVLPQTPIPASLVIPENVLAAGDAQRGFNTYSSSACIGCHKIRGNPRSVGPTAPDLTHIASRHTFGGGLFQNDARHLAAWIKNARVMKPGSIMQTLGKGQYDPIFKMTANAGALTDEQIADIVAYLRSLK